MGKTLGAILTIGAAVAVNVIPGAGQFISGTIFSGLTAGLGVSGFTAAGIALTAAPLIVAGVTVAGIQSLGGVLGLGPSAPKADTASTAIKTARPPRVSAYGQTRLYGSYILYEVTQGGQAIDIYAVHEGQLTSIVARYLNDDIITLTGDNVNAGADDRYGGNFLQFYSTDGSTPGAGIPNAVTQLSGIWTSDHRGDGVVLMALFCSPVKQEDFLEVYPNGVPTPSIVAQWQKCPDAYATDPTDPAGWTYTENVIRHLMHYKMVRENIDYATKIAPSIAYWRAAQDVCDEDIALKAGGTEKRYRSCISHQHTQRHSEVTSTMLTTCDGWMATRSDGALIVYAGKYYTPTVSIGPDQIVSYEWSGVGVDDDDAINELVCSYISRDHDYNSVETTAWRDEDDIAERGQILSSGLEIQTPSWGQVRRLAKRQMARTNAIYRGSVVTNVSGRIARGHRYINLLLEESGTTFYDGPAEITTVTRNMETGGLTFSWVAVDPNIDAWNPATEEGDPAALGDRVAGAPLTTPEITTAVAELGENGSSARIRITADGSDREDITWYARWRVTTDTTWNEQVYTDIDPGPTVELLTNLVPLDVSIDVAIAYGVGDGRISAWSATESVSTSTADLAPSPPSGFTVSGGTGQSFANWTNPTSPGFTDIRLYRNTTNSFGSSTLVVTQAGTAGALDSYNDTSLTAGNYYYFITARNATGIASSPIASGAVIVV